MSTNNSKLFYNGIPVHVMDLGNNTRVYRLTDLSQIFKVKNITQYASLLPKEDKVFERIKTNGGMQQVRFVTNNGLIKLIEHFKFQDDQRLCTSLKAQLIPIVPIVHPQDKEIVCERNIVVRQFNNLNITVYGTHKAPLFVANDVGKLLGINDINSTIKGFKEKHKVICTINYENGGPQQTCMLTEGGLYKVLMRSRKEIAEEFQDWVCTVLHEIRTTGQYILEEQIAKLNDKCIELEQCNKSIKEQTLLQVYDKKTSVIHRMYYRC